MSQTDKLAYIDAEKCLMTKPARLGLAGARTLFDELQLFHVGQTPEVHFVVCSSQRKFTFFFS